MATKDVIAMAGIPPTAATIIGDFIDAQQEESAISSFARTYLDETTARGVASVLGCWNVIGASGVAVSHTGNTNETALASITIPAGAMGANGVLRITALFSYTNSGNSKTIRFRFGNDLSGTIFAASVLTTTAATRLTQTIQNRNSASSQIGGLVNGSLGGTSSANVTGAIDTTASQTVTLSALLASAGETITLESYLVELFYQA